MPFTWRQAVRRKSRTGKWPRRRNLAWVVRFLRARSRSIRYEWRRRRTQWLDWAAAVTEFFPDYETRHTSHRYWNARVSRRTNGANGFAGERAARQANPIR